MPLCRVAWQAFASRLARAAPLLRGHVPLRQMSSGSVPGSSGENVIYYLLVVGAATTGGFYVYKTITSDKSRYNERIEDIQKRSTAEWKPKPWPPESLENDETETKEATGANEEAKDAATEETDAVIAGDVQDQREELAEPAESEKGEKSPVEEAKSGVPEGEQEAADHSAATQDQDSLLPSPYALEMNEEIICDNPFKKWPSHSKLILVATMQQGLASVPLFAKGNPLVGSLASITDSGNGHLTACS